jgi:hypothetical protein
MQERDWLEKIFKKSLEKAKPDLEYTDDNFEEIYELIEKSMPSLIESFEKHINIKSRKILKENRRNISKFNKRLNKRWKTAIDQLEIFIAFNLEYGIIVSDTYRKKKPNDIKFETLLRLHARACQISNEILVLIKNGFADGAMARWRSIYEISILANFLEKGSEELCQRYLDYYFIENHFETLEYQKNCERLGCERLSEEEILDSLKSVEVQKEKYGNDFGRLYGWIGDALPKKKWNFAGMEETIEFKYMRSFYKMANNFVHSGAKGFIFNLGQFDSNEVMLAGPSNYGFADPGQNTAFSLFQTTLTLSEFDTYLEDSLYIKIGANMLDKLGEEFLLIQKKIEDEEDEIRNTTHNTVQN